MNRAILGEFEELILTMVAILKDEAYGNAIVSEIHEQLDRKVNLSAVHVTLYRLEDKGFLISRMAGASKKRGGRRKRYFEITSAGLAVLSELKQNRISLWNMIPELKINGI